MKKYIIPTIATIMVGSTTLFATITYFNYITGTSLSDGIFVSDGGGNAGNVNMTTAYLDGYNLKGSIDIQSVGSGLFDASARIVEPTSGNPTRTCWGVTGTITSVNAGVIRLSGADTDVKFNPVSRNLEGYGYNEGIGRVPVGQGNTCNDGLISDTEISNIRNGDDTNNTISTTSAGFVGRVKVIGNAGGKTIFDTFYSQGVRFNASLFNSTLQRIRKNVGLLVRNLGSEQKNGINLVGDKMFFVDQPTQSTSTISNARMNDLRSLIVVGGDLYIDQNFTGSTTNTPKGIIVLKSENGVGGNIYVGSGVMRIDALIFAEGTVYSGTPTDKYNDTVIKITTLPPKQLYIFGAMISRNTIGGASASALEIFCPYNTTCTYSDATQYDLNYFRGFQSGSTADRAYHNATLDDYSLIIETDNSAILNPPPGFE